MFDEPSPPYLAIVPVWDDPDLIEMEVRVVTDDGWSGIARAYGSSIALPDEARALGAWSLHPHSEVVIELGTITGYGWVRLRFFVADMAGHVACEASLATRGYKDRSLSVVLRTEPALVERFARRLAATAEALDGDAVLTCV